ncbi:MAG: CinA family nicotinamide mononucleotide deamidase-related protein [Bacteroidetes bacterium]|nr:MAG: CinA family nicotinamide mononucleotide deamidase-related protein [Bacteroidota bacterium]
MTVYLLTIGDEILIGQIVDTNSAWMSRALNQRGFRVYGKSSVADTPEAIREGLELGARHADVVILTGGLGPTKDDVTKKTLADYFDSGMSFHQETYDNIAAYFEKVGRPMPDSMVAQATLPDKAVILPNKVGSAQGMWFELAGKVYVSLPGVPFEMEYLMNRQVIPRLVERFPGKPIAHRTLLTAGAGESTIAKRLEAFEDNLPDHIKLAYLPNLGQVRLRLTGTWDGESGPAAEARLAADLDAQKAALHTLVADLVYGEEADSLEQALGRLLLERGLQFGTAESCTGGYIAHLITSVPGASAYFPGTIVSYSYEMKTKLLGVKPDTLATFGAVSAETVQEMALGALDTLEVDIALAVSGIAGPDGGTPDKPVGTVWMAVADRDRVITARHVFARDRLKNIQLTAVYGLDLVRRFLLGKVY